MATSTISLEVDSDAAKAFSAASPADRRNLQLLLSLRLRELTTKPSRPLREVMEEIAANAAANGMTPQLSSSPSIRSRRVTGKILISVETTGRSDSRKPVIAEMF
jgi:hypothetical protein